MAVVTVSSPFITALVAVPKQLSNANIAGAVVKQASSYVSFSAGDSSTSIGRCLQLPSTAVVTSLKIYSDGIGGTTSNLNIGVWSPTAYGLSGSVVDADCFATNQTAATALNGTEICHEAMVSGTSAPNGFGKALWEVAGLSADPGHPLDINIQLHGIWDCTNGVSYVGLVAQYVDR